MMSATEEYALMLHSHLERIVDDYYDTRFAFTVTPVDSIYVHIQAIADVPGYGVFAPWYLLKFADIQNMDTEMIARELIARSVDAVVAKIKERIQK